MCLGIRDQESGKVEIREIHEVACYFIIRMSKYFIGRF